MSGKWVGKWGVNASYQTTHQTTTWILAYFAQCRDHLWVLRVSMTIDLFYTPTQINHRQFLGAQLRIGGMVEKSSLIRDLALPASLLMSLHD